MAGPVAQYVNELEALVESERRGEREASWHQSFSDNQSQDLSIERSKDGTYRVVREIQTWTEAENDDGFSDKTIAAKGFATWEDAANAADRITAQERAAERQQREGNQSEVARLVAEIEAKQAVVGRYLTNAEGKEFPYDAVRYPQQITEAKARVEQLTGSDYESAVTEVRAEDAKQAAWDAINTKAYEETINHPAWQQAKAFPQLDAVQRELRAQGDIRADDVAFVDQLRSKHAGANFDEAAEAYSSGVYSAALDKWSLMHSRMVIDSMTVGQALGNNPSLDIHDGRTPHSLVIQEVIRGKELAEQEQGFAQRLISGLEARRDALYAEMRDVSLERKSPEEAVGAVNYYRGRMVEMNASIEQAAEVIPELKAQLPAEINIEQVTGMMQEGFQREQRQEQSQSYSMSV